MTTKQLSMRVAKKLDEPEAAVQRVLIAAAGEIADAVLSGEKVLLHKLGKFWPRERRAYPGRNPKTGATVAVGAKRFIGFRPAAGPAKGKSMEG